MGARAYFILVLLMVLLSPLGASAQSSVPSAPPSYSPPPVVQVPVQPTPQVTIPVFPLPQLPVTTPTLPLIPTDFTRPFMGTAPMLFTAPTLPAGNAVKKVDPQNFPVLPPGDSDDGIIVKYLPGTDFSRPSKASVCLTEGAVLVSVRKPAAMALVTTPHGDVSIESEADVVVRYEEGVLRVMNLTGLGERVKIKVHGAEVSARVNGQSYSEPVKNQPVSIALKVGHEVVSADRRLTGRDLHPHDGVGRRQYVFIEADSLAVSEFSLESALSGMDLLVDLQQKVTGVKERRVLGDMAKMASVLNYMNGESGYTALTKPSKQGFPRE